MDRKIIAVNIANSEEINSNVSDILSIASSDKRISDIVMFLPSLGGSTLSILNIIAKVSSVYCSSVDMHLFIEEDDRYNLPFNHVCYLKQKYPKVSVHSKEDKVWIGNQLFENFSLESFTSDELDDYLAELYSGKLAGAKKCIAVSNPEDIDFISGISNMITCLRKGEVSVFSTRLLDDSYINIQKYLEKNISSGNGYIEELKKVEAEQLRIMFEEEKQKVNEGPKLIKANGQSKKKGTK